VFTEIEIRFFGVKRQAQLFLRGQSLATFRL
jgi:hypothetical protein